MPTYEYECTECGFRFEQFQGIKEKRLDKCPKCSKKVRRLISPGAGLIFKGSGFYATDYRKPSAKQHPKEGPAGCPHAQKGCHGCGGD